MKTADQFDGYHHYINDTILDFEVWEVERHDPHPSYFRTPGWYWWTVRPIPKDPDLHSPVPTDHIAHGPYPTAEGAYLAAIGD